MRIEWQNVGGADVALLEEEISGAVLLEIAGLAYTPSPALQAWLCSEAFRLEAEGRVFSAAECCLMEKFWKANRRGIA